MEEMLGYMHMQYLKKQALNYCTLPFHTKSICGKISTE